jgi:1,4-dihydroxy-2-naphthoate octaprenyltransferase
MESTKITTTIEKLDPLCQEALRTGFLREKRVLARATVGSKVLFEEAPLGGPAPRSVGAWARAVRAYALSATLGPALGVGALSFYSGEETNWTAWFLALLGVAALQVAVNVLNDVSDYERLIDLPGTQGGSGVIQDAWWTPAELRTFAYMAFGIGAVLGMVALWMALSAGRDLWVAGVLVAGGIVATLGYSTPGVLGLKYIGLGEVAVLIGCGPLITLGMRWVAGDVGPGVVLLGWIVGFLACALLHVNNLEDMMIDRERGARTLAQALGFRGSQIFTWGWYAIAAAVHGYALFTAQLPWSSLLGWVLAVPLLIRLLRDVSRATGPASSCLSFSRVRSAQIHLLVAVGAAFGMALHGMVGRFL